MIQFNGKKYAIKALLEEARLAHKTVVRADKMIINGTPPKGPAVVTLFEGKHHLLVGTVEFIDGQAEVTVLSKHQLKRCDAAAIAQRKQVDRIVSDHLFSSPNADRRFTGQRY